MNVCQVPAQEGNTGPVDCLGGSLLLQPPLVQSGPAAKFFRGQEGAVEAVQQFGGDLRPHCPGERGLDQRGLEVEQAAAGGEDVGGVLHQPPQGGLFQPEDQGDAQPGQPLPLEVQVAQGTDCRLLVRPRHIFDVDEDHGRGGAGGRKSLLQPTGQVGVVGGKADLDHRTLVGLDVLPDVLDQPLAQRSRLADSEQKSTGLGEIEGVAQEREFQAQRPGGGGLIPVLRGHRPVPPPGASQWGGFPTRRRRRCTPAGSSCASNSGSPGC